MKELTKEQFDKLRPAKRLVDGEWIDCKFYSRSRMRASIAVEGVDGYFVFSNKPLSNVMVDDKILPYKDKYQFTNPKNPF